jgi:GNAT superfamily N-acetyltransferase
MERDMTDMAHAEGFVRVFAKRAGQLAGGAAMCVHDRVAQLCGAATLPAHRRKGVQSALLSHRLAHAAAAGCDIATITTLPGSKSQQNAQSRGFELLYARAHLVLDP